MGRESCSPKKFWNRNVLVPRVFFLVIEPHTPTDSYYVAGRAHTCNDSIVYRTRGTRLYITYAQSHIHPSPLAFSYKQFDAIQSTLTHHSAYTLARASAWLVASVGSFFLRFLAAFSLSFLAKSRAT